MRNSTLHELLEVFTIDAANCLAGQVAAGAEVPFEITRTEQRPSRRPPLYCYLPLTADFIRGQAEALAALPSYERAVRAFAQLEELGAYLRQQGEARPIRDAAERAEVALRIFLSRMYAERSEFGFDPLRFEAAYAELEHALYEGRSVTTVIAPILGVALDHPNTQLTLGDGITLVRGDSIADAPSEAVWGEGEEANVIAVLATDDRSRPPLSVARSVFRRLLTALRLFERGGYALGPIGWARTDSGPWQPVPTGGSGRPRLVTFISGEQEVELRTFCSLLEHRAAHGGELHWALARFEMGCERVAPFEAVTDYLLALRALLEPEGPGSGRLAGRLAIICARPEDRAGLAERVAHAISLERAVIAGLAPAEANGAHELVDELSEHLRALLRDVLCGHLEPDLRRVADELLDETAVASSVPE